MTTGDARVDVDDLRRRVTDAEETLRAIRAGETDALLVLKDGKPTVLTLASVDRPYRTMVEEMEEGAATISPEGVLLFANSRFAEMVGLPLRHLIGSVVTRFLSDADFASLMALAGSPSRGGRAAVTLIGASGAAVPAHVSVKGIDLDGTDTICLIATDLTEYRRVEDEVRQMNEDLERQVAARTAELEEANQGLQLFSYSVSHDLRAPLRAIGGFAAILAEDYASELPPEAQAHVERIVENAGRMDALLDGLLALSRIGTRELWIREVDIDLVVRSVVAELEPTHGGRDVSFVIGELPQACADETLVELVFTNLVSNALKFTRDRHPAVVEIGSSRDGTRVVYHVRDNGVGFDMNYAGKLFVPFQRLHSFDAFEGTGIGLATVQRIVQRHGGRAWADGRPGEGATFSFTLGPADAC